MYKRLTAILCLQILGLSAVHAGAINPLFSVDPASPSIDGNITPDDVLRAGPQVYQQGTSLGLQDDFFNGVYDNLNALSYGRDPIQNPLFFSVDRVTIGLPGSDVNQQAAPGVEEAAGDIYQALPPFNTNTLVIDEQQLGLFPGFFGDDVDALDLDKAPSPWTYFSFDALSASNGFGMLTHANDIYASTGNGNMQLYFDLEWLGFDPFDDLDALVLFDFDNDGLVNPGTDRALFSLSTFSPSAFTYTGLSYNPGVLQHLSPADVLWTDFTNWGLWASANELGLYEDDELNALDTIPEPGLLALLGIGGFAMFATSRQKKTTK